MTSGAAARTASAETIRSVARDAARKLKIDSPPAISINSSTHPIPEIKGSGHSSKNTHDVVSAPGQVGANVRLKV